MSDLSTIHMRTTKSYVRSNGGDEYPPYAYNMCRLLLSTQTTTDATKVTCPRCRQMVQEMVAVRLEAA